MDLCSLIPFFFAIISSLLFCLVTFLLDTLLFLGLHFPFVFHSLFELVLLLKTTRTSSKGGGWMEQWGVTSMSRDPLGRFRSHVASTLGQSYRDPWSQRPARDPFPLSTW